MGLGYSTPEPIYAVMKSPNWGKNIFGPPVQLPTRPRRNYSYMSRKNNSRNTSSSPSFKLFVVRHGISCANVIKTQEWAYTFGARRSMYTDPELSSIGRKQAIENGPRLQFELRRRYGTTFDQMIIGSSNMLRAQQTAFLLTRSSPLYIVPYVSELSDKDPLGLSADNMAFDFDQQNQILEKFACDTSIRQIRNTEFYDPYVSEGGAKPSIPYFKEWLSENYRELANGSDTPNMLLVSHSGFIKKLYKDIAQKSSNDIKNYSVHVITVEMTDKGVQFKDIQELNYGLTGGINFNKECEEDTCRKPIGCSKKANNICEVKRGEGNLYTNLQKRYSGVGGTRRIKKSRRKTKRR